MCVCVFFFFERETVSLFLFIIKLKYKKNILRVQIKRPRDQRTQPDISTRLKLKNVYKDIDPIN